MNDKLIKIINNYGVVNQLKKFNEECFELEEAIIKHNIELENFDEDYDYNNALTLELLNCGIECIAQEIADCYVMLEQFRLYYGIDNLEIEKIMDYKINRQLERIEKEKRRINET